MYIKVSTINYIDLQCTLLLLLHPCVPEYYASFYGEFRDVISKTVMLYEMK